MAWDSGTITSSTPWADLSAKLKALCGGSGVENWSFLETVPAGTGVGQSGSASYALDVFQCKGTNTVRTSVGITNKINASDTSNIAAYTFNAGLLSGDRVYTLSVINSKASAADQPVSVTLSGVNAPVFTLLKTQAGGNVGEIRASVYLAKSGPQMNTIPTAYDTTDGLAPYEEDEFFSGPVSRMLTVNFSASQTGCLVILDEWTGLDMSLAADSLSTTSIAVQAVSSSGTSETAHSATLAAFLSDNSVAYSVAAETASAGTYSTEWFATAADLVMASPAVHARAMVNPDTTDTTGVLTLSSATSETSWACIALELQRAPVGTTSTANLNDAGSNWYFVIEVPVTDGAVTSSFNCAEGYELNLKAFGGMPPQSIATVPSGSKYWIGTGYGQYASAPGNNRANTAHQILNTSGFNYWVKLTKNAVLIATRVGATEAMGGAMLLDSFVTNTPDFPLVAVKVTAAASGANVGSNTFTRLPGVTVSPGTTTTGWAAATVPWTRPTNDVGVAFTSNVAGATDLWGNGKIHASRLFATNSGGRSAGAAGAADRGYARGLWKNDFLCIAQGGTVQIGDTMTIAGNAWTVLANGFFGATGALGLVILTRAI